MPSIRITTFGGINNEVAPRLAPRDTAQVAHNCLLWDGALRPLAKWVAISGVPFTDYYSIGLAANGKDIKTSKLLDATFLQGGMFPDQTKVGLAIQLPSVLDSNIVYASPLTDPAGLPVGLHKPTLHPSTGVNYSRQYKSSKPVNRMYGVTAIRRVGNRVEESVLTILPNQSPQSIIYEGDTANITIVVSAPLTGYTALRIYRTISGMDTGTAATNEFDTDWHLVAELPSISGAYVDGGSVVDDPLDVYLSKDFYPPPAKGFSFLQTLEGGWIAAVSQDGEICVSERHMYHAWPIENRYNILGQTVTDCKAQFDNLFIGTTNSPYIAAFSTGEGLGLQCSITPFPENYACLPNTMDKTPNGAMYASPSGVVSLSREGMRLVTAGVAMGVSPLYNIPRQVEVTVEGETKDKILHYSMRFQHTTYGAYHHGIYFGFCTVETDELTELLEPLFLFKGYMLFLSNSLDGAKPLQRITTFDTPTNVKSHIATGDGLYVLSDEGVFKMPFPDTVGDEEYARAAKYCYNWKSKKFVFPGNMSFGAAKVVHDCKGFVRLKIYADCCCVYETLVEDCKGFTLPPNITGTEFEVEVVGTSTVHEIHIASSLRGLLEHER